MEYDKLKDKCNEEEWLETKDPVCSRQGFILPGSGFQTIFVKGLSPNNKKVTFFVIYRYHQLVFFYI